MIAGPVPEWADARVKDPGLAGSVVILGTLDRSQIKALARQSDCVVVPSDHEYFCEPSD